MRGPPTQNLRSGQKPNPWPNVTTAQPQTIPAPVSGWNTLDSLAAMKPTYAVLLDNLYPNTNSVELRGGKASYATGFPANVRSLLPYSSKTATKFFASTDAGIYDITTTGAIGGAVVACTSGKWNYVNFVNTGNSFLVLANGVDAVKNYDGTTWTIPAITVATSAHLCNVVAFKHRLWFVENNSMSAWYLGTDAIAGAAVEFPMGQLFKKGGYLMAQYNWTIDGGGGVDDLLVTVTSEGEMAVYQGTDPASATTFALVGVYDVGQPIGRKCFTKYGGDVIYLSEQGLFPLSKLLQSTAIEYTSSFNEKITSAFIDAATTYKGIFGWSVLLYPPKAAIIVNVPTSADAVSGQFVMNDVTKAWCSFSGWSAAAMELYNGALYTAVGHVVYLNWVGTNDNGAAIVGRCSQAYTNFRYPGEKSIGLVRPTIQLSGSASLQMALDNDFTTYGGNTSLTYSNGSSVVWDTALWDAALWDAGNAPFFSQWYTVPNRPGFFQSFRLQVTTSRSTFKWISTDYLLQTGGIL